MLPKDQFPSYFLKLEIEPSKIDINIHPTKTEIKFEEERAIYAIIRTAVRQALGKYNIAPSLDFEQESSFDVPALKKGEAIKVPSIEVDPEFNPFNTQNEPKGKDWSRSAITSSTQKQKVNPNWESLYREETKAEQLSFQQNKEEEGRSADVKRVIQLHKKYILSQIRSGFILVDQQRAHERILIEKLTTQTKGEKGASQQLLFPEDLELNAEDSALVESLLEEMNQLGFDISSFGKNHFIIHGIPVEANGQNGGELVEKLLEEFKENLSELKNSPRENVIRSLAQSMSIKKNRVMTQEEMIQLIDELFACEMPYSLPDGKVIVINYSIEDLEKQFNK